MGTMHRTIPVVPSEDPDVTYAREVEPRRKDADLIDIFENRGENQDGPLTGWSLLYEWGGEEIDGPFRWPRT